MNYIFVFQIYYFSFFQLVGHCFHFAFSYNKSTNYFIALSHKKCTSSNFKIRILKRKKVFIEKEIIENYYRLQKNEKQKNHHQTQDIAIKTQAQKSHKINIWSEFKQ
jgi:hypothetical protein